MDDEDYMDDSPPGYCGPHCGWTGGIRAPGNFAQKEDDEPEEPNTLKTLKRQAELRAANEKQKGTLLQVADEDAEEARKQAIIKI